MPPDFYPPSLTDASKRVMESFLDDYPEAILIGGWGTWLRLGSLLSHDIDVILEPAAVARVRNALGVTETTHVGGRKYRASTESGVKIDLYVPYQSELGQRLRIPVEVLLPHAERVNGRLALTVGAHVATKFAGLLDRPETNPGQKDRQEIWGLLTTNGIADFSSVIRQARGLDPASLVAEGFELLGDLTLSRNERHQLRALSAKYEQVLRVHDLGTQGPSS